MLAGCSEIVPNSASNGGGDADVLMTVSDGKDERELLTYAQTASVGEVEKADRAGAYRIPVDFSESGLDSFRSGLEEIGALENPEEYETRTHYDGEIVYTARLSRGFADAVENGDFTGENFPLLVDERATAGAMKTKLQDA